MDGWIAGLIAILILGFLGLALGFIALYQQNKTHLKKHS